MSVSPREAAESLDAFFLNALEQTPGACEIWADGSAFGEPPDEHEDMPDYPEFDYREDGNYKALLKQFNGDSALAKYWYDRVYCPAC